MKHLVLLVAGGGKKSEQLWNCSDPLSFNTRIAEGPMPASFPCTDDLVHKQKCPFGCSLPGDCHPRKTSVRSLRFGLCWSQIQNERNCNYCKKSLQMSVHGPRYILSDNFKKNYQGNADPLWTASWETTPREPKAIFHTAADLGCNHGRAFRIVKAMLWFGIH